MNLARSSAICALLAALTIMQACVPSKKGISVSDGFDESIRNMDKVAVMNDVMIIRSPASGSDYVSIEHSLNAASHMLAGTKQVLSDKGYVVDYEMTPYIGAFVIPDTTLVQARSWEGKDTYAEKHHPKKPPKVVPKRSVLQVKVSENAEAFESLPPFYASSSIEGDSVYAAALLSFVRNFPQFYETFSANDTVRDNLSVIRDRVGARYLLFTTAQGVSVSGAKSLSQGLFSGCLTTVVTMGMVTVSVSQQSELSSFVGLVDLDKKEMIWKNKMDYSGGDPTSEGFYSAKKWPRDLLYHLPGRNGK